MALAPDDIHRITVDEYLTIVASGDPRWEHTELIEGIVYDTSPEHLPHAKAVMAVITALLAVEVSVTTLAKDGGPKRDLYARSGVDEYWLVLPAEHHLLRHRAPVDGAYSLVERVDFGDDLGAVVADLVTSR